MDILSSIDHRAGAEKQTEDPPVLMVPLVTSLSLILCNLWAETEIKHLTVSQVCFRRGALDHQTVTELWSSYPNFLKSEQEHHTLVCN